MSVLRLVLLSGLGLVASGCINSTSLIKVNADGSGTIEQTMLVNMATLKGVMATMGAKPGADAGGSVLNEADFKRAGERMGVKPVSLTPVKEGGFEGSKAIYAFDDITKVRVDQGPEMSGSTSGAFSAASPMAAPIKFGFSRQGGTSVLTITVDEGVGRSATTQASQAPSLDQIDPSMLQVVKQIFEGFRVLVDVEVEGKIVETNADYVQGSRVTLLDVDMGQVLSDLDQLKMLQSKVQPGASFSEVRPFLKDIKGVKMNHPSVTIEYR